MLIIPIVALAALASLASLALPAGGSNDPCTASLSASGTLTGGPGRDVLCGSGGNDSLQGLGGHDELRGRAGNDDLDGGLDGDDLFGGDGDDNMFGSGGGDDMFGNSGGDVVSGGSGSDALNGGTGDDDLRGGTGNDLLDLRDGGLDARPTCGDGSFDHLDIDLVDAARHFFTGNLVFVGCESITIGAVNEGANVVISRRSLRVRRDGGTSVRLSCPRSLRQPSRCRGLLTLQLTTRSSLRRKAPGTRYRLRPGQARRIPVRLSRSDRQSLRRRGRAKGLVKSVERGQHGNKTTTQTVRLKARR